jgi:hypothetical protein
VGQGGRSSPAVGPCLAPSAESVTERAAATCAASTKSWAVASSTFAALVAASQLAIAVRTSGPVSSTLARRARWQVVPQSGIENPARCVGRWSCSIRSGVAVQPGTMASQTVRMSFVRLRARGQVMLAGSTLTSYESAFAATCLLICQVVCALPAFVGVLARTHKHLVRC